MNKTASPTLVDLGKQTKKKIKALKRGEGSLAADIRAVAEEGAVGMEGALTVVLLYEVRPKKRRGLAALLRGL